MPFLFLIASVAAIVYFLKRAGLLEGPHSALRAFISTAPRGWLLFYMVALAAQLAHSLFLTVGSVVMYSLSLADHGSFIPLWALLIYDVMNLVLLTYGAVVLRLLLSDRRAAIANNILFNALSVAFLISWFLLGAKSPFGAVVDSLPGIAAITYFLFSRRVRGTYTAPRPA
jgi:hypothetical protein